MAPFDVAHLSTFDFIFSLTSNRLAFHLLQNPELVQIKDEDFLIVRDIWGFAGPDPRSFPQRLIDCFQFTGTIYYQVIKKAAFHADCLALLSPKKFFNEAPLSQEQAWSAWLLADAARQALKEKDDEDVHREQALVDALLLRFRSIIELAPLPEGNEVKEVTAAQIFQLKVETAGLIRAAEDLMSLSRELKEMWLFGPLRSLNEGEARANARIDKDARAVTAKVDSHIKGGGKQHTKQRLVGEKANQKLPSNDKEVDGTGA